MLTLFLFTTTSAWSCSCKQLGGDGGAGYLFPGREAVHVPRDTALWIRTSEVGDPAPSIEVRVGGKLETVNWEALWDVDPRMFVGRFERDLPAFVRVELGPEGAHTWFETGNRFTDPDVALAVRDVVTASYRGTLGTCGRGAYHELAFDAPGASLVFLRARSARLRDHWSLATGYTLSFLEACGGNEPTLVDVFHRRYEATPFDAAGRSGEGLRFGTAGCQIVGPITPMESALLCLAWLGLRRRRATR
ncbi:MAG: hypothetical protein AAF211_26030 [Myxococcota bacterium]